MPVYMLCGIGSSRLNLEDLLAESRDIQLIGELGIPVLLVIE